jgi:hypothetical protein
MDLGTENRLAALLLEEARRLRAQAEKEGVHAYLQKPNVRHRPNSRFLAATVLGVQQGMFASPLHFVRCTFAFGELVFPADVLIYS